MWLALIQKAWTWSSFYALPREYGNLGWARNIILQILFSWPVHFTLRNLKIQFQRKGWCFPQHKPTRAAFNSLSRFHFLLWRWLLLKTNKAWITLNADPRKIKLLTFSLFIFFFHLRKVEKKTFFLRSVCCGEVDSAQRDPKQCFIFLKSSPGDPDWL